MGSICHLSKDFPPAPCCSWPRPIQCTRRLCTVLALITLFTLCTVLHGVALGNSLPEADTAQPGARELLTAGCYNAIPDCQTNACDSRYRETVQGTALITKCSRCNTNYRPSVDGRRCDCAPGAYFNGTACVPCPLGGPGYYCLGGPRATATYVECGGNLTNLPDASIPRDNVRACVTRPGYGYVQGFGSQIPYGIECSQGSYSTGYNNLPCTVCPDGLSTNTSELSTSVMSCKVPPGSYRQYRTPSACPSGTYQPGYTLGAIDECIACPTGVTTAGSRSTQASDCALSLPGYGLTGSTDAAGAALAAPCGLNTYNPGGAGSPNCLDCPNGWETRANMSTSRSNCLVPPGNGYNEALTGSNKTERCIYGYNQGWNRGTCVLCGTGINSSEPRLSSFDCVIQAGQGLIRRGRDGWQAINCSANSWGASGETGGLAFRPCRSCGKGMVSPPLSTSPSACTAGPGWYVPVANQPPIKCDYGTFKSSIGNATGTGCTSCPTNYSTTILGATAATSCEAGPGYEVQTVGQEAVPCDFGYVKEITGNATCIACSNGLNTTSTGSTSQANCTVDV